MPSIKQVVVFLISLVTYVFSFYAVGRFMLFLSTPKSTSELNTWVFTLLDNKSRIETAYGPVVMDAIYIILFILQHSFMKIDFVKNLYIKMNLVTAERAIYSLTSSFCLHFLVKNWIPAPSIVLWYVDVENSKFLWWIFVLIHALAWIVIYGGCYIMDLPDILGIKSAYYDMVNCRQPNAYKSYELRHLYNNVRHPSFTGLTIIFWVTNLMTIDRLVLSIMLTSYMYIAWSTSPSDIKYQRHQLKRKASKLRGAR